MTSIAIPLDLTAKPITDFERYKSFVQGDRSLTGKRIGKRRLQARAAIREAIESPTLPPDPPREMILQHVDRAYPWPHRPSRSFNTGYKAEYAAWLEERQILVKAIAGLHGSTPDAVEYGALMVVIDLVQQAEDLVRNGKDGDELYRQAAELAESQAPSRHNRKCAACGSEIGIECFDIVHAPDTYIDDRARTEPEKMPSWKLHPATGKHTGHFTLRTLHVRAHTEVIGGRLIPPPQLLRVSRIVPHEVRILPIAQSPVDQNAQPLLQLEGL